MLAYKFDLQFFAEGGDGGNAGGELASPTGVSESDDIQVPSFIPEKKKALYKEVAKKVRSTSNAPDKANNPQAQTIDAPTATTEEPKAKKSFAELVETEYKADLEEYMHKAFRKRFGKVEALENENATARELLTQLAEQHGIDAESKTFMEDLRKAMNSEVSTKKVEEYMNKHDVPEDEARRVVEMERKLAEQDRAKKLNEMAEKAREEQKAHEERMEALKESAKQTKAKYPEFDLEADMKNEAFVRMLAATGGNTTMAYVATHHEELMRSVTQKATADATAQVANAVASNQKRVAEGAMSAHASSVADVDISSLNRQERKKLYYDRFVRGKK